MPEKTRLLLHEQNANLGFYVGRNKPFEIHPVEFHFRNQYRYKVAIRAPIVFVVLVLVLHYKASALFFS